MTTEREYQAMLIQLEQQLDGFVGAAFVELATGRKLAAYSVQPAFDPRAVAAAARAAVAAQLSLMKSPDAGSPVVDMLVTMGNELYLYHLVTPAVILIVSADRAATTPGIVGAVARDCIGHLSTQGNAPTAPLSDAFRAN
jgi:hypothetical protein